MFSANSEPTMTVLDPNLEYLMLTPDPYNYYMFYEIDHNVFHKTCPCKYIARNTGHMTHSLSHSYHNYMLETK